MDIPDDYVTGDPSEDLSTVEVYDPRTDMWESKADMPTARGFLANNAPAFVAPNASFTFQAQLMADGRVIFGYNGVADTVSNLDEDLVIGLSRGFGTGEAVRKNYTESPLYRPDLSTSAYEVTAAGTVYEVFDEGSKAFDLDGGNLVFAPFLGEIEVDAVAEEAADAFEPPPIPEPGSLVPLGIGIICMIGLGRQRRKRQT